MTYSSFRKLVFCVAVNSIFIGSVESQDVKIENRSKTQKGTQECGRVACFAIIKNLRKDIDPRFLSDALSSAHVESFNDIIGVLKSFGVISRANAFERLSDIKDARPPFILHMKFKQSDNGLDNYHFSAVLAVDENKGALIGDPLFDDQAPTFVPWNQLAPLLTGFVLLVDPN